MAALQPSSLLRLPAQRTRSRRAAVHVVAHSVRVQQGRRRSGS